MIEIPETLLYLNIIFSGLLFVIWTVRDSLNCLLKMGLFFLFAWNGLFLLEKLGYLVKLPIVGG